MQKLFKMTKKELKEILEASRPVPYICIGGIPPTSPRENANRAWERLGKKRGFDYMTVKPVPGKSQEYFYAEVTKQ